MINWRKPILQTIYFLARNPTLRNFKYLQSIGKKTPAQLQNQQEEKLRQLLLYSYQNVPYYQKVLSETGVIKNNKVILQNFDNIPILTKKIIREQADNLYSKDYKRRKWYYNTSGGSTGEPVTFIQDKAYKSWGMAFTYYCYYINGRDIGQPMLKLWGSERDVFKGAEKISTRIQRFLFNITMLNSFKMSESDIKRYVTLWNKTKPAIVHSYTSSVLEFAKYVERSGAKVYSPVSIICTAETLTEEIRYYVEKVLKTSVLNQYGSREAGFIGCECLKKEGLHIFPLNNKIEILDDNLKSCEAGQIGNIYVTTLNNYSMPLIRYKIGDTGIPSKKEICSCGRGWPLIESVTGRQSNHFRTKDGKVIHGEYFTHLFYMKRGVRKFQVIQHDYNHVEVTIVPDGQVNEDDVADIRQKILLVLGSQCKVIFRFVEEIPTTTSGKFRYTISKVIE
jgi:phenylacetate-CoA ligase